MSKILLLIIVVGLVPLFLAGVIEVKVHFDRLGDIPGTVTSMAKDKQLVATVQTKIIALKRAGEQVLVRDDAKRLELALLNVREDSTKLQEMIEDDKAGADTILPRAQLLLDSLERVRSTAEQAPAEVVASSRAESRETFALAQKSLAQLIELREEYAEIEQQFAALTSALEEQVGNLDGDKKDIKKDDKLESSETQVPQEKVPLSF